VPSIRRESLYITYMESFLYGLKKWVKHKNVFDFLNVCIYWRKYSGTSTQ